MRLRPGSRRGSRSARAKVEPWLYLGPALLWFLVFSVFPLVYTINMSLRDWSSAGHPFIGLAHYAELIGDRSLYHSLRTTAIFALGAISLSFLLGFAVAVLLANEDLWGKTFFRSVLILPYVISDIVVGISFRLMFHPILGVINYVLGTRGWDWFGSPQLALPSITLVVVWHLTPFFAIILLAGLLSLPKEPYEAARIDGAGSWRLFRHLTLPMMRPVCQVVLLMGVIDVIKVFGIVFTTTQGGPARLTEVIGMYVFRTGFLFYRFDYASAMALGVVVAVAILAVLAMRALSERSGSALALDEARR
ncbi:MAG TPA: sugar ABC transporter permease [Acetobacteraceae bacterium]